MTRLNSVLLKSTLILCLQVFGLTFTSVLGQTVFWTEDWESVPCAGGDSDLCRAHMATTVNGQWTVNSTVGVNGPAANIWFISCTENGCNVGTCGATCGGCGGNDYTLHIANDKTSPNAAYWCANGDCGAAYDAGGLAPSPETHKRIESPPIDCSTRSTITFAFNYLSQGQVPNDGFSVYYFDGSSWSLIQANLVSVQCGGGQGEWTAFSTVLPASANNNSNVRIGFDWHNDDDGFGTDPSVAIDQVTLSVTGAMPIELVQFFAKAEDNQVLLNWEPAITAEGVQYEIEHTGENQSFKTIGKKESLTDSQKDSFYSFTHENPLSGINYYRLKEIKANGAVDYSKILSIVFGLTAGFEITSCVQDEITGSLVIQYVSNHENKIHLEFIDANGKTIFIKENEFLFRGENVFNLDISQVPAGIYFLNILPQKQRNEKTETISPYKVILR